MLWSSKTVGSKDRVRTSVVKTNQYMRGKKEPALTGELDWDPVRFPMA